ncbi:MAG: energy transducer TonB [Rhodospirillales bacterium]|nr:energy transducer TonB [Rhodospirillales bacterium]
METLYRARNWFASAPSIFVLLAAIILTAIHTPKPVKKTHEQPPMRVTIAAPPVEPPPPMPELPKLPEVTPDVAMPVIPQFTPRATPKPTPSPKAAPIAAPQETAVVSAQPVNAPPVAQAAPPPTTPAENDAYTAQIKAYLESIKHYPTSKEARLQRPRGAVDVWIVVDRSGAMKEAEIENSSGSLILDGAALSTVRGAAYPAFPAGAFKGESTHRFKVQLNYSMT